MKKSTHSQEYELFKAALVKMRQDAGLTQRELAQKLGREHSFVWRIEKGERRLDVVEFFWVCRALGQDPAKIYAALTKQFRLTQRGM